MHTDRSLFRLLLVGTGILFAAAAILIAGTRTLALRATPRAAGSLAAGDCASPCWHGFRPGEALVSQMTLHASRIEPINLVVPDTSDNIARSFSLATSGAQLTAGDVIRVFGPPEYVHCLMPWRIETPHDKVWSASSILYWENGLIAVETRGTREGMRLNPGARVVSITYYAPGPPTYALDSSVTWRGFASIMHYPLCRGFD